MAKTAFDASRSNVFNFVAEDIVVNPAMNVSRVFEPSIEDLIASGFVDSIKANGQLQPGKVRKNFEGKPELIFGFQRLKAILYINSTLPEDQRMKFKAEVVSVNDEEAAELNIEENLRRSEISALEKAHLIRRYEQQGKTVEEIAKKFRKSDAWVNEQKLMLTLPGKVQSEVHKGIVPANVAIFAAKLDPAKRDAVLAEAKTMNPSGKVTLSTAQAAARKHEALPENRTVARKLPEVKKFLQDQIDTLVDSNARSLAKDFLKYINGTPVDGKPLSDVQMGNRWIKFTDGEYYGQNETVDTKAEERKGKGKK